MRLPNVLFAFIATLTVFTIGVVSARGDDWPQFRKDGGRTGASKDVTRFPVTDVWAWSTRGLSGDTPTFEAAVVANRIYFTSLDLKTRYLICADAKTGTPIWRQPLVDPMLCIRGIPAVSQTGKVFAYDLLPGKVPPSELNHESAQLGLPLANSPAEVGGFAVRVFDAANGSNLANLPIELLQLEEDLAEVVLRHPENIDLPAVRNSDRPISELGPLGAPLLVGDELQAVTNMDVYFRWAPGRPPSATRIHHPRAQWPAEFWGFPPVASMGGILVANDQTPTRFFGVLGGASFHLWHQDLQTSFGLPAAEGDTICVGMGTLGAARALVCLDSSSGHPRWTYAPSGLSATKMKGWRQKVAVYVPKLVSAGGKSSGGNFRVIRQPKMSHVRRPESEYPPGHESSGGVVLTDKQVFAEVDGAIVCLDRGSGRLLWRQALPGMTYVQSLVGSRTHVFACYTIPIKLTARTAVRNLEDRREGRQRVMEQIPYWDRGIWKTGSRHFVVAYRIDDGLKVWEQELLRPGSFSLSGGMIYFANGDLTAYGPAERTYLIAEDSEESKEYVTPQSLKKEAEEDPDAPTGGGSPAEAERLSSQESKEKEAETLPAEARADISILRLTYDTPLQKQLEQLHDRVKLLEPKKVPLILQLDWLDGMRGSVRGAPGNAATPTPTEFVARCVRLVREGVPLYFDIAPEVNVYLRRFPERGPAVVQMLAQAAQAVRQASPGCQVVLTFNSEVLLETYGKGMVYPFDKLPKMDRKTEPVLIAQLALLADAIGLSTRPYSGFRNAGVLPPDYLLRARKLFEPKPLLVTRIVIDADVRGAIPRGERAEYARRILQACYWLNARVVAQADLTGYPEMAVGEDGGKKDPIRQIAAKWQGVITWPRVKKLTAAPPNYLPDAQDPEGPKETGE